MWYKVDFYKLALLMLPTFLRKPRLYTYLMTLMLPIVSLYDIWYDNRTDNIKKLSYNSQRCYLRKALNDYHDKTDRRITIEATPNIPQDYIYYAPAETLVVHLGTMYLEPNFNYAGGGVDFSVKAPLDIKDKEEAGLKATLEFYKLAGKKYEIVWI